MRSRIIIPAMLLALAACSHRTPPGQPPLADLNNQSLAAFQAGFNRAASAPRVILLLSPT